MDKNKEYALAISLALMIGILLGIIGTKWLSDEQVCDVCPDCVCEKTECPETVCNYREIGSASASVATATICNEPRQSACHPSSLNANVSAINVRCNDGSIKVWLCADNKWQ
jgi:hypothetical protein